MKREEELLADPGRGEKKKVKSVDELPIGASGEARRRERTAENAFGGTVSRQDCQVKPKDFVSLQTHCT